MTNTNKLRIYIACILHYDGCDKLYDIQLCCNNNRIMKDLVAWRRITTLKHDNNVNNCGIKRENALFYADVNTLNIFFQLNIFQIIMQLMIMYKLH